VVYADWGILIEFFVTEIFKAFVFLRVSCTFLKIVVSCAEGACFFSSAVAGSVVESGAFKAPGSHHVILYFADLPSEFYLLVQKQLSNLRTHLHYQIPCVFPLFVAYLAFLSPCFKLTSVFCARRMSSKFPVDVSKGILMITSLGFLNL